MVDALWSILLELAPWLLLGAVVAGLLHVALPDGFVRRQLRGPSGVLKAVALGVPLPLCSCGVIPAGVGLKRDGASDGAAVAFLVSTPQTGVDSLLVSAGFLGWPFALFKVGAAAVTGVVAGLLTDALPQDAVDAVSAPPEAEGTHTGPAWRRALIHADDVLRSIWRWVVVGVVVSAALTAFLPAGALADTPLGSGVLAGIAVLALSVPLYVCATASVPIAAGLLHAGLPPSAALVFLMAGPATNVATLGAVRGAFGTRVLGVYLGTVALGSLGLGLLFDAVLPTALPDLAHHDHVAAWRGLPAAALLGLFARYAVDELRAWRTAHAGLDEPEVTLPVAGMSCGGCARKVTEAVSGLDGVAGVEVELEAARVRVRGRADLARIRAAVRAAGFDPG